MTEEEFQTEAQKLVTTFPRDFNTIRMKALWNELKDLPADWWQGVVHKILVSGNVRIDFGEIGRLHRTNQNSIDRTKKMLDEDDRMERSPLQDILSRFGVKSMVDAIGLKPKR